MPKVRSIAAAGAAVLALVFGPAGVRTASAVPTLQLDIGGGVYDTTTETIVATTDPFTLYALLVPDADNTLGDTYYVSAAITPAVASPADLGSFVFNGTTINVTSDMIYGTPPIEIYGGDQHQDPGDLPGHGIYETYFVEFEFQFDPANNADIYNSQDNPGGLDLLSDGGLYYQAFSVDTSGLADGYVVHFDLYNTLLAMRSTTDLDVRNNFAPFSHDAESRKVPEPASLLLMGVGLIGTAALVRRRARARRA